MKQPRLEQQRAPRRRASLGILTAALLVLGLLSASPATAAYEQVGTFAGNPGELHPDGFKEWPEKAQLAGAGGMAVNYTGAGGVPAGTLYAATNVRAEIRVARFNPDGSFSESWTFGGSPPKERCGPEGDPAHPVCASRPVGGTGNIDVEVDQSTGYVYLLNDEPATEIKTGENAIHVYSADGSELISEFGVWVGNGPIGSHPEQLHNPFAGSLALGPSGEVYVQDFFASAERLMRFEPQTPGDYKHYVYAGQASDIASESKTITPRKPVADAAGNIYVVSGASDRIAELDPDQPANPLLCEFKFPKGHIDALTVNPPTGEPFFFSDADKKIHQLSACEGAKFSEKGSFGFAPQRFELTALAYDPVAKFEVSRSAGVLWGAASGGEGGKTEGVFPNNIGESSMGYVFAPPKEFPPVVEAESVSHVTATTAELGTQINPKGPPTNYAFQYLTQAEYEANEPADRFAGAKEAPPGGGLLGEGPETLSAVVALSGLEADTTYHYRAIATNHCSSTEPVKVCQGTGADGSFHTFPLEVPGLPDERVWELVSPALKGSGEVLPADSRVSSCVGATCKPGDLLARFPMQSSPDGEAIVYEGLPFSEAGALSVNEYLARRDPGAGWQTTTLSPTLQGAAGVPYKAFNTELTSGVIGQQTTLSPEAPSGFINLYSQPSNDPLSLSPLLRAEPTNRSRSGTNTPNEFKLTYAGASNDLSRVFFEANDALTPETPFAPEAEDGGAAKFNLYEWEPATGEVRLVNVLPENTATQAGASFGPDAANAISDDGSRAFWSDATGQVYVREGAELTREIQTEGIPDPGKFLAASTDGSKVLLANGHLHDLGAETTTDLSEGKGGFQGISGQSEDLSHVYFVDTEVLSGEEENSEGDKAQAGKFNLYAWAEGGSARYVATLAEKDNSGESLIHAADWAPLPSKRTAEASPHGRYLTFLSQVQLTGYDNTGPCETDHKGGYASAPCWQVFLYDSATGKLSCPSCNPSGVPPLGNSTVRLMQAGTTLFPQPRYLTDQGRLYFDSRDSLVPADSNNGAEDVYEFEPEGIGSCKRAAGCISLLSAGREATDSNFLAMDETGENVFFTSRDQLALKDHDDLYDLYDARERGGIASETEVARSECQGEACVAAYSPPNDPTPGSSSFEGAGNVNEQKVQKKAKKHKRKHAKKKHTHKRANRDHGGAK